MPEFPTRTIDFKHVNSWGIRDGTSETSINEAQLLHAVITVGHRGMRGRRAMLEDEDWQVELNRRVATFEGIVKNQPIIQGNGLKSVSRMLPRKALSTLDPTEKGMLNYELGTTMASAWARKVLRVPWLLHLDVYWEALGMPHARGVRADMIGRHSDGRWIVVEAKGFKKKPTRAQQSAAKTQAQQINNIGGKKPALNLALITFFAPDPLASARPKPEIVHIWAVDPPSEDDFSAEKLARLEEWEFFKLYYEQWAFAFREAGATRSTSLFAWLDLPASNLRIGILPDVFRAVQAGDYWAVSKHILRAEEAPLIKEHPGWVGDGIVVESY